MAKCKKCGECEECPEWIFTFADLVMLMMGFFVILWVLKPAPGKADDNPSANEDWIAVAAAVREAFGYLPDPHSKDPVDLHMLLKKMHTINPVKGPQLGSRNRVEQRSPDGTDPEVQTIRDGKTTITGSRLLFDRGQTTLSPEVKSSLDQLAGQIRGHYTIVRVKGHTANDDLPENATSQQKMELSVRRAQAVVDYLSSHGVDPQTLRVEGCSSFEPVNLHAYTSDSEALNRRVEVEVTATLVGQRQGKGDGETPLPSSQPVDAR